MEYISSDTNIWLDFVVIDRLDIPFKLPYTYIMNEDAVEDELLSPKDMKEKLLNFGLKPVELSEKEFYLAEEYHAKYRKPSLYDCVALAIAKVRGITLLTGDGALRKAAQQEKVLVVGTIGILDQAYEEEYVSKAEYLTCMKALQANNGGKIRLPEDELLKRINKIL